MRDNRMRVVILPFILVCHLLLVTFSPSHAEVTLTVGKGSALPGAMGAKVMVSLENQNHQVKGVQLDVCDVDNYLSCSSSVCEPTERTVGFLCSNNELTNGCCRVILASLDGTTIEEGQGAIFSLSYTVSADTPSAQCRDLIPDNVRISDSSRQDIQKQLVPGSVCFPCAFDSDCDDRLSCNGEEHCVRGTCTSGNDPCLSGELCDERNDICVNKCSEDSECSDRLFCNGVETCVGGYCQSGTLPCLPGKCDEARDRCVPTTTTIAPSTTTTASLTTIVPTTTTTVPASTTIPKPLPITTTTTTATAHSYQVVISPPSPTLNSGETVQYTAKTTDHGEEVEGRYYWEIVPESSIGSEIDENGFFIAGDNTARTEIIETVEVTDVDHERVSATARVMIRLNEPSLPDCEVAIIPLSATVSSGCSLVLEATTTGNECLPGDYEWLITSEIGSVIGEEGLYSAGINTTGAPVTDIVVVIDRANSDSSSSAPIVVDRNVISIFPPTLLGSPWIPIPYFLIIVGEDSNFNLDSTIAFEPGGDIIPLFQIGYGTTFFTLVLLDANPLEGAVAITIDTSGEGVGGKMNIEMLGFPIL